jgi:hypothetical protein
MPIYLSENAILAARIVPLEAHSGKIKYTAMVTVSKGKNEPGVWGAVEMQSFATPQKALLWLSKHLASSSCLTALSRQNNL